ncbi:hypothetical protein ECP03048165_3186 [Escherichia coli P0304816.5]|nr:hypothetical protein ECP03048165_3186 [Escherichia coli P0304816.5]
MHAESNDISAMVIMMLLLYPTNDISTFSYARLEFKIMFIPFTECYKQLNSTFYVKFI